VTELKTFGVSVKAADGAAGKAGEFEAFAAVFGNVDRHGDRIMPGAFTATLEEWKAAERPIPVIWSHQWANPDAHIGVVLDAQEKEVNGKSGLWIRGKNDLEAPFAARVHQLLLEKRVTDFSFAYETRKSTWVEEPVSEDSDATITVRELDELGLFEVGPTLIGANGETDLLEAASIGGSSALSTAERVFLADLRDALAGGKAGRVLSAKNAADLASARDLIDGALAAAATEDDGKGAGSRDTDATMRDDTERRLRLLSRSRHEKE
jgi:HK97 family phage prohead protease